MPSVQLRQATRIVSNEMTVGSVNPGSPVNGSAILQIQLIWIKQSYISNLRMRVSEAIDVYRKIGELPRKSAWMCLGQ